MPWFISNPSNEDHTPDYGTSESKAITETSSSLVAAGATARYISLSVGPVGGNVYLNFGSACDPASGFYTVILPVGFNDNRFAISKQEVFAACASGQTNTVIVAATT